MTIGTPLLGTVAAGTTAATSRAPAYPTVNAGDLLVLFGFSGASANNVFTTPAGFTAIAQLAGTGNTAAPSVYAAYAIATGTETGTLACTTTNVVSTMGLIAIPGVDNTTPLDIAVATVDKTTASTTISFPTQTVATAGAMCLYVASGVSTTITATPPTGFTELYDHSVASTRSGQVAYKAGFSTGATGTISASPGWSGTTKEVDIQIFIRPAANPSTGATVPEAFTVTSAGSVVTVPNPGYDTVITQYPSLVGYWKCDDTSGTTLAATVGTAGAIAATGVTYTTPPLITDPGTSLTFDGLTGEVAAPGNFGLFPFTLNFWFSSTDPAPIIFRDGSSSGGVGWFLDLTSTNVAVRADGTAHTISPAVTSASLLTGARHQFGLTYDNTTVTAYIDGVQVDQWSKPGAAGFGSTPLHFFRNGTNAGTTNFYSGTVDQIGLFNAVLTPQDIAYLYATGLTIGATAPLTATISAAGTVSGASASGDSAIPLVDTVTSAGSVGKVAAAALALTFGVTAAGVVGTNTGSSVSETVTTTAAGVVGFGGTSSVPLNDTFTSAGVVGARTGSAIPLTFGVTSAGSVGGASPASGAAVPLTYTTTAAGAVGLSTGATRSLTYTTTATGVVAGSATAAAPLTFTVAAAGSVSVAQGAASALTFAVTAAGAIESPAYTGTSSVPLADTITSAGRVGASSTTALAETAAITSTGLVGTTSAVISPVTFAVTADGFVDTPGSLHPGTLEHTISMRAIRHSVAVEDIAHSIQAPMIAHTKAASKHAHAKPARPIDHTQEA